MPFVNLEMVKEVFNSPYAGTHELLTTKEVTDLIGNGMTSYNQGEVNEVEYFLYRLEEEGMIRRIDEFWLRA